MNIYKAFNKLSIITGVVVAFSLVSPKAEAAVITLDFEGIEDLESVEDFYKDDFGITFSANALALTDADAGGSGNFGGEPTPDNVLFFLGGDSAVMNVEDGFDTGFSFFYSAINQPGFINVYDGLNGTGNLLTTLELPTTPFNGAPDPTGFFSPFVPIGISFDGIAKSVDFGGSANQIVFDNITLNSSVPGSGNTQKVPEPTTILGSLAAIALGSKFTRKH
ncbi:MAG: PEP-CTERM sorting domain-containing protein [Cyanobacteria bacterium J06635_10]